MSKGMFVQCHGCGFTGFINLEGDFNSREKELNRMLKEGWRYALSWHEFICPRCAQAGGSTDDLYMRVVGKPRICDVLYSYVELRDRADRQLTALRYPG